MTVLNFADTLRLAGVLVDAAHLDRHRVYPLPPAFLRPPVGQVTTPDLPIDYIDGSVRIRAKVRLEAVPTAVANIAWQRAASASNITWDWYTGSSLSLRWRLSSTGTGLQLSSTPLPDGSLVVGTDQWIGTRFERSGNTDTVVGEMSLDGGVTWTEITNVPRTGIGTIFDSTAPITIGALASGGIRFPGRIYWAQMEAINRAQLVLPGVNGNYLTVPDSVPLNVTGDFEAVARVSRPDWAATYATIVSKDSSTPRGFLLRVAFNAINFAVPTVDGASQTVVNSTGLAGTAGQVMWVKVTRVAATGLVSFYSAPDQVTEPTTWTARGTASTPAGGMPSNPSVVSIGVRGTTAIEPWQGRIARVIIRDVIGTSPQFVFPGPGVGDNQLETPDASALDVTGDIEVVLGWIPADGWVPPTTQEFIGKYVTTGNQRSWRWMLGATGNQSFIISLDGTVTSSPATSSNITAGHQWIKVTRVAATGEVRFYSALGDGTANEPATWTAVGGAATGAAGPLFNSSAPLRIGNRQGADPAKGRLRRAIIRNGIGGPVVFDLNESNIGAGFDTTVTATSGQTVTETGNVIRGRVLDVSENDAGKATLPSANFVNAIGAPVTNSVTTPDAPDLNITGDVRVIARLRDDSVESTGSRYWGFKAMGPSDYGYSFLATYTNSQYATQGWPSGTGTPQLSQIIGLRTQFGTTPPGADVWLRADIAGVNPATQALTLQARGYTSPDGSTWTAAGTPPPAVRADAMSRDAAAVLRLAYVTLGRLYSMQLESINRAQLIFPGVIGNHLETTPLDLTGVDQLEFTARVGATDWGTQTYRMIAGRRAASGSIDFLFRRNSTQRYLSVVWYDGTANQNVIANQQHPLWNPNQMIWLRAKVDATTVSFWYNEADSELEPTTWTQLGTNIARAGGVMQHHTPTAPAMIGSTDGSPTPWLGRIARVIMRNPATGAVLLDVDENNAGTMGAASTFPATSGHTMTRVSTSVATYPIVTPQAPAIVWRFDANEWTTDALTLTDPRGRRWDLANAGTIARARTFPVVSGQTVTAYSTPGSTDIVTPQVPSLLWRFDANEWPGGASTFTDELGRTWTVGDPNALQHPASQPDTEVLV